MRTTTIKVIARKPFNHAAIYNIVAGIYIATIDSKKFNVIQCS